MGYYGEATIIQGEIEIRVTCSLETQTDEKGGLESWSGGYSDGTLEAEPEPGDARLRLPNGREGNIILTRVVVGSGHGQFQGSGPSPIR